MKQSLPEAEAQDEARGRAPARRAQAPAHRPRLGRACSTASTVDYYGTPTPLNQVATADRGRRHDAGRAAVGPDADPGDRAGDPQVATSA